MGAHPSAPARLVRGGAEATLVDVVARDPERELGAKVQAAFGGALPFLLKVLAAREPLSLQAHPNAAQARDGYDDEERRGVPRSAPHRNYKDRSHKPELLCALTPFDALCGFRAIDETLRLFDALSVAALDPVLAPLRRTKDARGLGETFEAIMTMPSGTREDVVRRTVDACAARLAAHEGGRGDGTFARECLWATRLAALYPGDAGVVSALLLNVLRLEPGQAIYLDAGCLHAYLDGVGVEIMASSDNVLRGGLTKKHVDVPELMRTLTFADGPVAPLTATPIDDVEAAYATPAPEFRLSVLRPKGAATRSTNGPEILLCTEGEATLRPDDGPPISLGRGGAAFVSASIRGYRVEGHATLYRATVQLP